jgi:hypothetical protein
MAETILVNRDSRSLVDTSHRVVKRFLELYSLSLGLQVHHDVYGDQGEQLRRSWTDRKTGQEQAAVWYEATDRI